MAVSRSRSFGNKISLSSSSLSGGPAHHSTRWKSLAIPTPAIRELLWNVLRTSRRTPFCGVTVNRLHAVQGLLLFIPAAPHFLWPQPRPGWFPIWSPISTAEPSLPPSPPIGSEARGFTSSRSRPTPGNASRHVEGWPANTRGRQPHPAAGCFSNPGSRRALQNLPAAHSPAAHGSVSLGAGTQEESTLSTHHLAPTRGSAPVRQEASDEPHPWRP